MKRAIDVIGLLVLTVALAGCMTVVEIRCRRSRLVRR